MMVQNMLQIFNSKIQRMKRECKTDRSLKRIKLEVEIKLRANEKRLVISPEVKGMI